MSRRSPLLPLVFAALAGVFCLPAASPRVLFAAEKKVPVLLSRAIDSAWEGDLQASRKSRRPVLSTKPAAALERQARCGAPTLPPPAPCPPPLSISPPHDPSLPPLPGRVSAKKNVVIYRQNFCCF